MEKEDYWFPAKTLGWGWALPVKWQGWVVYGVAFGLLVAIHFIFPATEHAGIFFGSIFVVILLLLAICWLKGEPPRWRWGK